MSRYGEFQNRLHEASFTSAISYSLSPFGFIWVIETCALRGLSLEFSFTKYYCGCSMKFHCFGLISQCEHCTQLFENVVLFVLQWYYLDYPDSLGLDEIVQRIGGLDNQKYEYWWGIKMLFISYGVFFAFWKRSFEKNMATDRDHD